VVFARVLDDPFRTEFSTVELDGRTPRRVGVLEAPDDRSVWLPASDWVVGDRALYMTMVGDTALPDGIWRFDLVDGSSAKIVGEEVGDPPPSRAGREPVDVGGEALLVAHAARLGRFTRSVDERDFFDIVDLGTGLVTPIRDRETDRVNRQAALSPDGSFVAVMAEYLGDDDRVRESAFQRISVASVASVVGGSPQWYDLATFDSKAASLDLGVGLTSLVWDLDDRLFAEMSDGLYRIELAEVG
jgi:hypothetical protein